MIPRVRSVEPMRDIRRQVERQTGVIQKTGGTEQFAEEQLTAMSARTATARIRPARRPGRARSSSSPTTSS